MDRMQLLIGQVLKVGVLLSFVIVFIGGGMYLWQHGNEVVAFHTFVNESPLEDSFIGIFQNILNLSAVGIIQFGLFFLVLVQLIRVLLTVFWFVQLREWIFVIISAFILSILIASLFWR